MQRVSRAPQAAHLGWRSLLDVSNAVACKLVAVPSADEVPEHHKLRSEREASVCSSGNARSACYAAATHHAQLKHSVDDGALNVDKARHVAYDPSPQLEVDWVRWPLGVPLLKRVCQQL